MQTDDKLLKMIKTLNNHLHASNIYVPILENFELEHLAKVPNCIFVAKNNNGFIEELFIEPLIDLNETLENKIDKIQSETTKYLESKNIKSTVNYFKDYKNGTFNFKIYVRTVFLDNKMIRKFDVFFLDDKYNDLYKLSLSNGPIKLDNSIEQSKLDKCEDVISVNLCNMLKLILDNIKYNNKDQLI